MILFDTVYCTGLCSSKNMVPPNHPPPPPGHLQLTTPENTTTWHNALCLSLQNFAWAFFSVSLGAILTPKRNWRKWLCKILGHYGMSWYFWSGQFCIFSFGWPEKKEFFPNFFRWATWISQVQRNLCIQSNPALWTPHYYLQFALSLGKESPYIFSKVNPLNTDTSLLRTVCCVPGERKTLHFL